MAYAEKRGKGPRPWRVKYKTGPDAWGQQSGFETKAQALAWGREQETDVRRGVWRDPGLGGITLAEWINDHWWPAQDLARKSRTNYRGSVDNHIIPQFGGRSLDSLDSQNEINQWERKVAAGSGPEAAKAARNRLITILQDAIADRRMTFNPARRTPKRGRKRKVAGRQAEKVWSGPLQALLLAERCALLSRRDDDFVMIVAMAYTGMRWGEAIGLEPSYVRPGSIRIEWQLVEDGGRFYRVPPKDDSYRTVDLPPFLSDLLSRQQRAMAGRTCEHVAWEPREDDREDEEPCPGGIAYLWLGEHGGHARNSNYIRRIFGPACEGWYPAGARRASGPRRPVLADAAGAWPGMPVPGAWTAADPAGLRQGRRRIDLAEVPVACWLPLVPGLTPHGLRHSHNVWLQEERTPEVLRHDRLGHDLQGMTEVYSHVSGSMRAELKAALQLRWEMSLLQRGEISARSPVPLLDGLLAGHRGGTGSGSPKSLPNTPKAAPR